jgi:fructose-bisphosphate aldolase, class II
MPLVTSRDMFRMAMEQGFAVGAFNVNNMEAVQAITEAAEEERSPVIVQVSQGAIRYAGLAYAAGLVKIAAEQVSVPVVLHLDHGTDFDQNVLCLRAGFTSLMYDGSKEPYEENVATTRRIAEIAHIAGIPIEAELGKVLQSADHVTPEEVRAAMTDPDQAKDFVDRTGADSLAVAVGSVHAMESAEAELDVERIAAIHKAVGIPLVLHGSSGVKSDSIVAAIENGVCKVNVATYLNQAFVQGMREMIAKYPEDPDYRKHLKLAREYVKERVREKIRLFGSNGRVDSAGGIASGKTIHRSADLGALE